MNYDVIAAPVPTANMTTPDLGAGSGSAVTAGGGVYNISYDDGVGQGVGGDYGSMTARSDVDVVREFLREVHVPESQLKHSWVELRGYVRGKMF